MKTVPHNVRTPANSMADVANAWQSGKPLIGFLSLAIAAVFIAINTI